jgi:hypothetical protein
VEIEGRPEDLGAELLVHPVGQTLADAAEGSDVVRPDNSAVLGHDMQVTSWV